MIQISASSRQPIWEAWTLDRLIHERSIALGSALDKSSYGTYSSALNSYLTFCKLHDRPVEPTEDTLSFYVVFMSRHIQPRSVDSYLSGICNELEIFYPNVRKVRSSILVSRTLNGCKRLYSTEVKRKRPLGLSDLQAVINNLASSPNFDDKLFVAQLLTGFHALLRLGELVWPDKTELRDWCKVSMRHTVTFLDDNSYGYLLPGHKADRFFEGNNLIVKHFPNSINPTSFFKAYITARDLSFAHNPELWLRCDGTIPTCAWFIRRLRTFFPTKIAGQSMRAGGATTLAECGTPPNIIQAMDRWASDTFQVYIRKNPVLLNALVYSR
jgi:hypothetical protein